MLLLVLRLLVLRLRKRPQWYPLTPHIRIRIYTPLLPLGKASLLGSYTHTRTRILYRAYAPNLNPPPQAPTPPPTPTPIPMPTSPPTPTPAPIPPHTPKRSTRNQVPPPPGGTPPAEKETKTGLYPSPSHFRGGGGSRPPTSVPVRLLLLLLVVFLLVPLLLRA
ncbi:hypothetical protein B0H34DRAFT_685683 [Crassisporium funariophilum]|nr:hypothetical protein B0H34DRAFT_685683 [Crassisporium funariophilum]